MLAVAFMLRILLFLLVIGCRKVTKTVKWIETPTYIIEQYRSPIVGGFKLVPFIIARGRVSLRKFRI